MNFPIFTLVFSTIIFPILLIGQSSWERITPLPQENTLNDIVKIPGTNKLISTGNGSTVMISSDAGETWQINYHPAGMDNNFIGECIYFLNSNIGFIGGSHFSILKTINGGNTWELVDSTGNSSNSDRLKDIEFINETTGFAIGDHSSIKKSIDGGETWVSIEVGNDFNLYHVEFCSETIGFIIGSSSENILKTIDGGNNWQIINYPSGLENFNLEEIYFYNETLGFIFCSIYGSSSTATILKTSNAGENWNIVHTDPSAFGGSIDFIDDQNGIIGVGSWYSSNIFITEDGGDNWTNIDLPGFSWWNNNSVCFLDQENAFFAGHSGMLFKSSNGGTNWELLHERTFYGEILKVQFLNEEIAYASSAGGSGGVSTYDIYKTIDGGNNWSHIKYFMGHGSFHFVNENVGYLAENMIGLNVYKTTNGGQDWTEIASEDYDSPPACIRFYDELNGLICIDNSILLTSDGGYNWIEVNNGTSFENSSVDIEYKNEDEVFVSSRDFGNTIILKSFDGGYTWENFDLGSSLYVTDIYFSDPNTVFLTGGDTILISEDGGETWAGTNINSQNYIYFNSICFPSMDIGYAVGHGEHETIVKSLDGGLTWNVINSGTTSGLNAVYFSDENNGLIAGQGGVILKTTTGGITGFEEPNLIPQMARLEIYPNPFANIVTINLHQPEKYVSGQLIIYDQAGKSIQNTPITNNSETISLSLNHLKPGVYFVQLKNGDGIIETKKMIKL